MSTEGAPGVTGEDVGKLVLRLGVGGLMLLHGIAKLQHGIAGIYSTLEKNGLPGFLAHGVYVGEVVAPVLILVGALTRASGLVVAFNMAVAVALVHRTQVIDLGRTGGWALELQGLYFLGGVALCFLGPGKLSATLGRGWWS